MDVDLLRPGTVPIAPDTVLWFEFLLHKDLLLTHLQKHNPDPSAIDLISKFYDAMSDTLRNRMECESTEPFKLKNSPKSSKHPAKNLALKILSLKVAAFIKWDLGQLMLLPFKTQIFLLQDLLFYTNNEVDVKIPPYLINFNDVITEKDSYSSAFLFALVLYNRWQLYLGMHRIFTVWPARSGFNERAENELKYCTAGCVRESVEFLKKVLDWDNIPGMLTFDCFKLPTETNDLEFDWLQTHSISVEEFGAQINYDLATYFFYKEDYNSAREHFTKCMTCFEAIKGSNSFINFDRNMLEVYFQACNGAADASKANLYEQLSMSIVNQYMGITTILQQDNIRRQIPLTHRLNVELDIQGALSSGTFTVARDLLAKIRALNLIRCVLDQKPIYHGSFSFAKHSEILVWAVEASWKGFSDCDKAILKKYLLNLILKDDCEDLLKYIQSNNTISNIFDKNDLQFMTKSENSLQIPDSVHQSSWIVYDCIGKRKPKLEIDQLEHELITTYDHKEIRELLKKLSANQLANNIWNINSQWDLPIPIQSVVKSLPRGLLQDFAFLMLAKAREQMLNKNWNSSLELMLILDKDLGTSNGNVAKLSRLISWEILNVQITQLLEEWPKSTIDKMALANACEVCLQTNESVLPRTEIIEQCVLCILNLGRWEFLASFDKRWPSFDITSSIALACQDLITHKGSKKLSKNLWDIVLPIFTIPPQQSKRSNSNTTVFHDAHAHITNLKNNVIAIFTKLRDSTALTVVISLLTRLYNVLKDETSLELQVDYVILWPAVVSNANSYSTKITCDILSQMVLQGLQYYPTNVAWLRLLGDINFANGHYNISLKYYLKSLLVCNDYFNLPVGPDDHVFRRMIKCCVALNCNTQAAVLCQFLEDPDYVLAFRILGEQKNCADAVDAYYHCIWDINILEYLIHIHNKRGEYQRRKCATQVMGLLELNSGNNEEIQREASNLRKSTFLRALCKQYIL